MRSRGARPHATDMTSLRRRPLNAFFPWPGGASAQFGHFSLTCEPGTRGPSCGGGCSAETYAFPSCCPTYRNQAWLTWCETSIVIGCPSGCQRIRALRHVLQSRGSGIGIHADEMLRFLPQDFHNCGKHCGKHDWSSETVQNRSVFYAFFGCELVKPRHFH